MKITCINPNHADSTPSMEIYSEGLYCFSCGFYRPHNGSLDGVKLPKVAPVEPEDLEPALRRIGGLKSDVIRGLLLPADERGYYIVWPGGTFYKYRLFKGEPRFLAPRGHKQPLLHLRNDNKDAALVIIEGELNALCIDQLNDLYGAGAQVLSPGSASSFISSEAQILEIAKTYSRVLIWTDLDPAGIKALWHIYPKLVRLGIEVLEHTSTEDANDILVKRGPGGLRQYIMNVLGGTNG